MTRCSCSVQNVLVAAEEALGAWPGTSRDEEAPDPVARLDGGHLLADDWVAGVGERQDVLVEAPVGDDPVDAAALVLNLEHNLAKAAVELADQFSAGKQTSSKNTSQKCSFPVAGGRGAQLHQLRRQREEHGPITPDVPGTTKSYGPRVLGRCLLLVAPPLVALGAVTRVGVAHHLGRLARRRCSGTERVEG